MLSPSLATVLLVAVAAAATAAEWTKPAFCKDNDCPEYEVLDSPSDAYEIRRYKSAKWVSTQYTGSSEADMREKMSGTFWKLFNYISGKNNEWGLKIPMTTPVPTRLSLCDGGDAEEEGAGRRRRPGEAGAEGCRAYERSFYLSPEALEAAGGAPASTEPDVYVHQWPEFTVYVRSFGGWANKNKYEDHRRELEKSIGDSDLYDKTQYYAVGYDSPMTWWNRHNEVWLLKKN